MIFIYSCLIDFVHEISISDKLANKLVSKAEEFILNLNRNRQYRKKSLSSDLSSWTKSLVQTKRQDLDENCKSMLIAAPKEVAERTLWSSFL